MSVIFWTAGAGSLIFALGLISALGSRHQQRARKARTQFKWEGRQTPTTINRESSDAAMKEAASGREEFAQIRGMSVERHEEDGMSDEGWMPYLSDIRPRPQGDLLLEFENARGRFIARPQDLPLEFNVANLRWRLTGIAKHQLEQKGYRQP